MSASGTILVGIFAGVLGTAYFVYGKREGRIPFLLAGAALCIYPYFVPTLWGSVLLGLALAAAPFFFPG